MSNFPYTHIMDWDRYGKKGESCQLLAGGNGRLVQIKFADGTTGLISRRAIRRPKESEKKSLTANGPNGNILAPSTTPSAGE